MAKSDSQTWRVQLDGRIHDVTATVQTSWGEASRLVVVVDGREVLATDSPNQVFGNSFLIGPHKCKIGLSGWSGKIASFTINGRPPGAYAATEPETHAKGAPAAGAQSTQQYHHFEQRVVERQIVVARCKYCNQLSPVDAPACSHCGGKSFC